MRLPTKLLAATAAVVFASATAAPQASATSTHASVAAVNVLAVPAPIVSVVTAMQAAKIEVKTTETQSGAWDTQPVWIAIGVIALALIIVLIISAGRRDTTVIK